MNIILILFLTTILSYICEKKKNGSLKKAGIKISFTKLFLTPKCCKFYDGEIKSLVLLEFLSMRVNTSFVLFGSK